MSRILVVCPSHRDRRELARLHDVAQHDLFFHEYASDALERMVAPSPTVHAIGSVHAEIEAIVARARQLDIAAVLSTDDYPGSAVAAAVARQLGLPGSRLDAVLKLQHKPHARRLQHAAAPEVVPRFRALASAGDWPFGYSCFVKPVKSFFSIGAQHVEGLAQMPDAIARATLPQPFFQPLIDLFERYADDVDFGKERVIGEDLLHGRQATIEGYVFDDEVTIFGVIDSSMYPSTSVFRRFEYPSRLPAPVQQRMADAARAVTRASRLDHGMFNVEFMADVEQDTLHIVEVNPRMASQFADLHEKVDGFNPYVQLIEMSLGRRPPAPPVQRGPHAAAISEPLRRFSDARVLRVPKPYDVDVVLRRHPGARVEVLAREGGWLSRELQDGHSFRYGVISAGGEDRADALRAIEDCRARLPFAFAGDESG